MNNNDVASSPEDVEQPFSEMPFGQPGNLHPPPESALGHASSTYGAFHSANRTSQYPELLNNSQLYNDRGHPVNPITRQMMRDHVQASNEVMLATGVTEQVSAAHARDKAAKLDSLFEASLGERLCNGGQHILLAGVWGLSGMRRRLMVSPTI